MNWVDPRAALEIERAIWRDRQEEPGPLSGTAGETFRLSRREECRVCNSFKRIRRTTSKLCAVPRALLWAMPLSLRAARRGEVSSPAALSCCCAPAISSGGTALFAYGPVMHEIRGDEPIAKESLHDVIMSSRFPSISG